MRTPWSIPQISTNAIEVIDDLSAYDGEFADESFVAVETCVQHISEAEFALV
jgi:hypothetical protein